LLIPRPEFGALSSHQRALVDQVQRATYSYASRRIELVDTERSITAAKGVVARARLAEGAAITREVLELAQPGPDADRAELLDLHRRLDAATRRARATRQRAEDDLAALNDRADEQRRAAADALAERAAAESGLQDELGPDAVRAKPDGISDTLARAQAGQPEPAEVGGLVWPIPGAALESPFGLRNDPLSNGAGFHPGADVKASYGTEVHSAAAGHVVRAGDCGGYGSCVVIDHGDNVATLYGHLSQIDVSVGDTVATGDVIGLAGSTGWSTGAHLHFEVRVHGLPIDPVLALGDTH
jgi:murein DD-endopeptidase MepM/ murein hydrolase activator NlpD